MWRRIRRRIRRRRIRRRMGRLCGAPVLPWTKWSEWLYLAQGGEIGRGEEDEERIG